MSSFFKNTSVYFISNILNASIPFILLPILTRYLTPDEYGQVAMFQVLTAGLLGFIGVNTVGAAARKYFDDSNIEEVKIYNFNCFYILLFSSIICLIVIGMFGKHIAQQLSIPLIWLYWAVLFCVATFIIQFRLTQWQVRELPKKYGVLQVSLSLTNFLLALLFVIFLLKGAEGRVLSLILSVFMLSVISLFSLYKEQVIEFSKINIKYIKESLIFGFPLIPHIFGTFLLTSMDRVFITKDVGLEEAGIYMLAFQLSMGLQVVFDAINKAYTPFLYKKLKENEWMEKRKLVINTYKYFIFLIFVMIFGFYIGPFLITLLASSSYHEATTVIGFLIMGQVFSGMYLMVTNYIFYSKQTFSLSLVTISSGLINMALLFLLIPSYGMVGAAYSFSIAMFIRFLLTWVVAYKKIDMPWFSLGKYE